MLRRLPISLRFDDEDADFYYGFIEQKKNDRELSTLILDLLYAYYDDKEIQSLVDTYIFNKNPYIEIQNQLNRIASEHSRHIQSASMLKDFTANEQKKVSEPPKQDTSQNNEENKQILALIQTVERMGKEIDALKKGQPTGEPNTEKVDPPIKKSDPVPVKEEPFIAQTEKQSSVVETPIVEKPTIVKPMVVEPEKPAVNEPVSVVNATEVVKKPASFGKLLNSVK